MWRFAIIPIISIIIPNAGSILYGFPDVKEVTKYVGEPASFAFIGDPTNGTGGAVVSDPIKTVTVILGCDITKFTTLPTVKPRVDGASVTPFQVPEGYKFIFVAGGDITPKGALFEYTLTCPGEANTYPMAITLISASNAALKPVRFRQPITGPTIIVKNRPLDWQAAIVSID